MKDIGAVIFIAFMIAITWPTYFGERVGKIVAAYHATSTLYEGAQ